MKSFILIAVCGFLLTHLTAMANSMGECDQYLDTNGKSLPGELKIKTTSPPMDLNYLWLNDPYRNIVARHPMMAMNMLQIAYPIIYRNILNQEKIPGFERPSLNEYNDFVEFLRNGKIRDKLKRSPVDPKDYEIWNNIFYSLATHPNNLNQREKLFLLKNDIFNQGKYEYWTYEFFGLSQIADVLKGKITKYTNDKDTLLSPNLSSPLALLPQSYQQRVLTTDFVHKRVRELGGDTVGVPDPYLAMDGVTEGITRHIFYFYAGAEGLISWEKVNGMTDHEIVEILSKHVRLRRIIPAVDIEIAHEALINQLKHKDGFISAGIIKVAEDYHIDLLVSDFNAPAMQRLRSKIGDSNNYMGWPILISTP